MTIQKLGADRCTRKKLRSQVVLLFGSVRISVVSGMRLLRGYRARKQL